MIGPYEIIRKVSSLAYELKLPPKMRCHPVFHVSLLEPYYENGFKSRTNNKWKNIHLNTDLVLKIPNKIINMKILNGKKFYLMTYKGYDHNENEWVEESQIFDQQLIQEYLRRNRKTKDKDDIHYINHRYQPFVIDIPPRRN